MSKLDWTETTPGIWFARIGERHISISPTADGNAYQVRLGACFYGGAKDVEGAKRFAELLPDHNWNASRVTLLMSTSAPTSKTYEEVIHDHVDPPTTVFEKIDQEIRERYALGLLTSEMGESLQVIGNAQRFGLDTPGKDDGVGRPGRYWICNEIGDVEAAIEWSKRAGLLDRDTVDRQKERKLRKLTDPNSKDNLGRRLAPELPKS